MYILATSIYSQAIFKKMKFEIMNEVYYNTYKNSDGSDFFKDLREHKSVQIYYTILRTNCWLWTSLGQAGLLGRHNILWLVPGSWSTPSQHSWHLQIVTEITTYHLHGCFGRSLWWHVSALVQYIFVLSLNTSPTNLKTTGYYVHITDPLRLVW